MLFFFLYKCYYKSDGLIDAKKRIPHFLVRRYKAEILPIQRKPLSNESLIFWFIHVYVQLFDILQGILKRR